MSSTQMQTAVGRFVWHDHQSDDPKKAQEFYGKLLGWTYEPFKTDQGEYPMITKNDQQHGGFGQARGGAPSHWVGHVVVDDAAAAAKRAEGAGGTVLTVMDMPEVGKFAVIRDPQGAVISAFAPAGEAQASEGAFAWDELHTSDLESAKRFYNEVFGWTANEQDMGGMTYVLFRSGDTDRAGAMTQMPGEQGPPNWLTYALTDDVDAKTEKVKELGGNVIMEPMDIPNIGRFSIIADPTGAVFGLFQAPA
jgi:predicted enzyme related to lactoylglutathione lyase